MLNWSPSFSTGVGWLDDQHRALIDRVNELEKLIPLRYPSPNELIQIIEAVDFIEKSSRANFCREQSCLNQTRCQFHEKNNQAHKEFWGFFQEFKNQCHRKGVQREAVVALHTDLCDWIHKHILLENPETKPFCKGLGPIHSH